MSKYQGFPSSTSSSNFCMVGTSSSQKLMISSISSTLANFSNQGSRVEGKSILFMTMVSDSLSKGIFSEDAKESANTFCDLRVWTYVNFLNCLATSLTND